MALVHARSTYIRCFCQPALRARWLFCGTILALLLSGCSTVTRLNLQSQTTSPVATNGMQPSQSTNQTTVAIPTRAIETTVPIEGSTAVPTVPVVSSTVVVNEPTALPSIEVTPPPIGEAAWNAQKVDVNLFATPQTYRAPGSVLLWWYDSNSAQFVGLGWIKSPITATGEFRLRWSGLAALIVPYRINADYGLILDPTMVERIRRAGYTSDTLETFIYLAPDIVAQ